MKRERAKQPSRFELNVALDSFIDEYAYSGSRNTERHYREHLRPFREWAVKNQVAGLDEVTADDVRHYLREQRDHTYVRKGHEDEPRTLARSTLIQRYSSLHTFFEWCVTDGRLLVSPMANIKRPKPEANARFAFSRDEAKRLVKFAGDAPGNLKYRDTALILIALGTGARASELLGMRWPDVHWAEGYIVVNGKGAKERRLRLGKDARRALKKWQDVAPPIAGGYIWVTIRRTRMSLRGMWMWMHKLGEYAGVENCHPHRLRHTFAAEFTTMNRDVYATKARLGHSKLATTEGYLHSLGVDYGLDESYRTPDSWLSQ